MDTLIICLVVAYALYILYFAFSGMKIVRKAGYARWWGALVVVPILNLIVLSYMAFETWPVLKPAWQIRAEKIAKLEQEIARLKVKAEKMAELQGEVVRLNAEEKVEYLNNHSMKMAEVEGEGERAGLKAKEKVGHLSNR